MAYLYQVKYKAFGTLQINKFEFESRAIQFADKMKECGFDNVRVCDEFGPRGIVHGMDRSIEIVDKNPVYEP